jgi:hypothetical protein
MWFYQCRRFGADSLPPKPPFDKPIPRQTPTLERRKEEAPPGEARDLPEKGHHVLFSHVKGTAPMQSRIA